MVLNDENKAYVEGQYAWMTKNSVEVGTMVRVTRIAGDGELGWCNDWPKEMDDAVGEVFTVTSSRKLDVLDETERLEAGGISLDTIGRISMYYAFMFPYYVLEVVG